MGDGDDDWGPGCRGIIALLAVFGGLGAGLVWAILEGSMGWILAAMAALLVAALVIAALGPSAFGDTDETPAAYSSPPAPAPVVAGKPPAPAKAAGFAPAAAAPVVSAPVPEPEPEPAPAYNPLILA